MKKATLKQIAQQAGVSMTTVHRALNGKGGCSAEVEERIRTIAGQVGYSINLAASALRKQPLNVAMIFPFRDNGGRFYIDSILDGYLEYRRELQDYNIVFQEFLLRSSDEKLENYLDMEYPELENILKQIDNGQPVRFDGVIIYGMSVTRKAEALLNRIMGGGTKVIVMERVLPTMEDVCTVMADAEVTGKMAAEILCSAIQGSGTVGVISQMVPGGDPNADICIREMEAERPDLKAKRLGLIMNINQGDAIAEFLSNIQDLVGVYVTCGRHTKSAIDALEKQECRDLTVIGSELFEESYKALNEKLLTVVLDKRPAKIGYMALDLLLNQLVKGKPLPERYLVPPRVILRSNSHSHYVKREYQHESERFSD